MPARLKFRYRISLLVLLAAVALVIVTIVTLLSGSENTRQLTGIETRYVPLIELDGTLKRLYLAVTRTLEDAAGAGEQSKIDEADRLSAELRSHIANGSQVIRDNGGNPVHLDASFVTYYTAAREVSAAVVGGTLFQDLAGKIETMRRTQREFSSELDAATTPKRAKLAAAFAAARESQATSLRLDIVVACVALLLMGVLSWRIIRRTIRVLGEVSAGVERLASGDFSRSIEVTGNDEFADLGREANRAAQRLRDYRERIERETWIETGIAELAACMSGEREPAVLAEHAMTQLASYIGATTSAIYIGDEAGAFRRVAANGDAGADSIAFLADDQSRLAALVRDGALATRAGEVALPLSHDGRVFGVLLLGLPEEPSDKALDLLRHVASLVGIALRVAESREQTHALLIETQRQARAAESANKELEAFSYSVSHDLRAPLRGIDGFSQALVEDEAERLSPAGQGHLRRIRAAAQRMAELIDDMLRLSRVSRADFRRNNVDLSAIAESVVADLSRANPDRRVDVTIQPGVTANADAPLVRIALENLLGNAWKFTSKTEDARIEFGARRDGGDLVYFVRDNGAGFDMKYVDRLFGAFQRLHTDKEYPGTGIGLATVQRVVLRHGGRIWVEAAIGQGARFQFTLPDEGTLAVTRQQ